MKAITLYQYGSPDVLQLTELEKPIPADNEVLVRVHAVHVNFGDIAARKFRLLKSDEFHMPAPLRILSYGFFGYRKPKINILGSEFSGTVETVGNNVTRFKAGEEVFGYRGPAMGANAEYLAVPEDSLVVHKPANLSHEEIATIPYGALTALTLLRKVNIQPGQKVLINGASGSIGSHALQLAKYYGAEVTAVCGTQRVEFVKELGADHVIDYKKEDFTKNGEKYDVIFDVLGKSDFSRSKGSLTENGIHFYASFKMKQVFQMLWTSLTGSKQKVVCALSDETLDDLVFIKERIEAGDITTVIDRCYPLKETAEAHRYLESGQKTGNVVITIQ